MAKSLPNDNDDARTLISGAGCTGLALAQGPKKAGIPCIFFERHASLSPPGSRDWNMRLHWGGPILQSLFPPAQWAQLQSLQVDPTTLTKDEDTLQFINGQTGDSIAKFPANKFFRLRRTGGVGVTFEDGTKQSGHLIVGCDGAKSTVRTLLLGSQKAECLRLPYAATWVQSRYTRDQALFLRKFHPLYIASPQLGGKFAFFGMHDAPASNPEAWTFFTYISFPWTLAQQDESLNWSNEQKLVQVKELVRDYCEPWKSAFEWMGEGTVAWHMERGQGLNHSLTDAHKLRNALMAMREDEAISQATAIGMYEDEMIARGGEEVRLSAMNTRMLHDWELVRESPMFMAGMAQKTGS